MTDMGLGSHNTGPRWSDCPLEPRVRDLEGHMAVAKRDIQALKHDMDDLPEAVAALTTQTRITWAIMSALLIAIIAGTVSLIYTFAGVP